MSELLDVPIRRPRATIVVGLLLLVLSLLAMTRLHPETSINGLLDPTDPAVAAMDRVLNRFPLVEELLVLVTLPEGESDATKLTRFAERLAGDLETRWDPTCGALVRRVQHRPADDMLAFARERVVPNGLLFLDDASFDEALRRLTPDGMREQLARLSATLRLPGPAGAAAAKSISQDPLRFYELLAPRMRSIAPGGMRLDPGASPNFFSPDQRSLLIRISGTRPPGDLAFCHSIVGAVNEAIATANGDRLRVDVAGAYAVAAYNADAIRRDAIVGVNGSIAGIFVLFLLLYRRPLATFTMAFVPMAIGIAWGFGAFAMIHPAFTPLAAVIGGALAGIGIDYLVFFLTQAAGDEPVERSLARLRGALLTAWATSCIGFVAVAWSPIRVLRDFALLGVLALAGAYVASITLLPSTLALLGRPSGPPPGRPIAFTASLARHLFRRRRATLATATLFFAAIFVAAWASPVSLRPQASVNGLHPHPNPPLEAQQEIARRMGLAPASIQLYLRAADATAVAALAHEVDRRLQHSIVRDAGGTGAFGLASVLPDPRATGERLRRLGSIDPDTLAAAFRHSVATAGLRGPAFAAYEGFLKRFVRPEPFGAAELSHYSSIAALVLSSGGDNAEALTLAFFDNPLSDGARRDAAIGALQQSLGDLPGVTITGMAPIGQRLEASVRRDLPVLASIAIVLIGAVHTLHFRSVGLAAMSLVPTAASAIAVYAFMKWTSRPLDLVNMVMVPLLIGIDTDYGILTVNAWLHARTPAALRQSFPAVASGVITCAGTTLVGFGSLIFVTIPAIASLGWLIAVGIVGCLVGTLALVWPAMFLLANHRRAV